MGVASVSIADGAGAAANVTAGSVTRVTPGNNITIALQSSTGINSWIISEDGTNLLSAQGSTPADGKGFRKQKNRGDTFSVSFQLPQQDMILPLLSSTWDGYNNTLERIFLDCRQSAKVMPVFRARGVVTVNETIATFDSVSGGTIRDGVTYAQGDVVLLAAQSSAAQNGLYIVGVVAANSAPLTRHPMLFTGDIVQSGLVVEVSEGTIANNSRWKMTTSGNVTIGTTAHNYYPQTTRGQTLIVAGTFTISAPVLAITQTSVILNRITATTCTATYGGYHPSTGGVTGLTAGIQGTGAVIVQACVVAGTINAADSSLMNWSVQNF